MKKSYVKPEVQMVSFEYEKVLAGSGCYNVSSYSTTHDKDECYTCNQTIIEWGPGRT